MRLWHYKLISILDRQRLLGQHRECCALRGNSWGKNHSTVNYVFDYPPALLVQYHFKVMEEMRRRNYFVEERWKTGLYRGKKCEEWDIEDYLQCDIKKCHVTYFPVNYPYHDKKYWNECVRLLKEKDPEYYNERFI